MTEISLSGALPKGDANGLAPIVKSLIRDPEQLHALLVIADCNKLITHVDTGETIPVLRIRRVEVIQDQDLKEAERLVRRSWEKRNGDTVLPLELEDDIQGIFRDVGSSELEEPPAAASDADDEDSE